MLNDKLPEMSVTESELFLGFISVAVLWNCVLEYIPFATLQCTNDTFQVSSRPLQARVNLNGCMIATRCIAKGFNTQEQKN